MDKYTEAQAASTSNQEDQDTELPAYTGRGASSSQAGELSEHTYKLEDSKGRPWIWLTVKSRAKDKKTWPLFYERDVIQGTVEVDFDKTDGAKGVSIGVTAGVTAVGQEELTFLTLSNDLWDSKSGGKAKGRQSWPFSISLPGEAAVAERPKARADMYRLPPTFTERASPAYIDYKLVVTVRRGALRVNQTLTTSFFYTPLSRADPPSTLRQAAYQDGHALVGPEGDPTGWKVLPPVQITGTLFSTRTISVECTVAIATPLSYATGSPIPLEVTFSSEDEQALDILCAANAVRVHLYRERLIGSHAIKEGAAGQSNNTFRETMGTAAFWPSQDGVAGQGKRRLQGEIDVRKGLRPTFVFPRFTLRYALCMLPSEAPGFVPANPDAPLFTERVIIHTLNAVGVVPRSFAPPGYVSSTEGNYNTVAGYLENGNQRFYHHHGFM
ncbi:hypothetical protein NM688_g2961 [Phlebia brevispora]|uniref:Uncharacterized protein n=1 Tax=Phlebia brevispora TaxID=194682 RepID=A0ACC1T7B7_9APHY|nr:hypothetical protein NM688_g2961 [Phlebia brevispora]